MRKSGCKKPDIPLPPQIGYFYLDTGSFHIFQNTFIDDRIRGKFNLRGENSRYAVQSITRSEIQGYTLYLDGVRNRYDFCFEMNRSFPTPCLELINNYNKGLINVQTPTNDRA